MQSDFCVNLLMRVCSGDCLRKINVICPLYDFEEIEKGGKNFEE